MMIERIKKRYLFQFISLEDEFLFFGWAKLEHAYSLSTKLV